jgi:hypothetical protein
MRLQQGQIWKKDEKYYRITQWARLTIHYKITDDPDDREGPVFEASKKEFCRLIKGAQPAGNSQRSGESRQRT